MRQCERCGSLYEESKAETAGCFCSQDCENDFEERASVAQEEFRTAWIEYDLSMNG